VNKYFSTLKFTSDNSSKREKALNRAYQLRTFEIEHYWKRANYFWGFQIVIFAAFGLLGKDAFGLLGKKIANAASTEHLWNLVLVALSVLGALTAVANFLSARGSKFWIGPMPSYNACYYFSMRENRTEHYGKLKLLGRSIDGFTLSIVPASTIRRRGQWLL
jgi:hypothetical protein